MLHGRRAAAGPCGFSPDPAGSLKVLLTIQATMSLLGPEGRKQMRVLGSVGTAGIELAVATVVGLFGGRWLDGVLGTGPWLQWIGLALGLVAGFHNLFRITQRVQQQLAADDDSPDDKER
jgi:ATP synthase protein I